ncbi:MAG: hypothetical protein KDA84_15580 [Planctomycetaceae bacterium]|nr:hypothetical protein [Planctomycetaceae bacterium]
MTKRVSSKELDYGSDGLYYLDDQPFTGIIEYRPESGWLEAEEEYKNGLQWGLSRKWHRKGVLEWEAECAFGARHGLCREWDEAGHLIAEDHYEFGVRVHGKQWDSKGNLTEEFEIQESDPGFELLQAFRTAYERDRNEE